MSSAEPLGVAFRTLGCKVNRADSESIAAELLGRVIADGSACLSSQILGEFYVTVTRRFPGSMDPETASQHTERFAELLEVHSSGLQVVLGALRGVLRYRLSYYEAQIWAVARLNHVPVVFSEDFAEGAEIEGVRFRNPFAAKAG